MCEREEKIRASGLSKQSFWDDIWYQRFEATTVTAGLSSNQQQVKCRVVVKRQRRKVVLDSVSRIDAEELLGLVDQDANSDGGE